MYCKNCGVEISEDINFCPKCGFGQKKSLLIDKIEDNTDRIEYRTDKIKDVSKRGGLLTTKNILVISFLLLAIASLYLLESETRSIPYQESYEDPVYRTEYYQEPVYVTQSYTYSCGFLNLKTCSDQRQVIDHYETKSKQVFDSYETKYRTKYKDVTKKKYQWLVERFNG